MTELEVMQMQWYNELIAEVDIARAEMSQRRETQTPPLEDEKRALEKQIAGWSQSLAKPDLAGNVRLHIEQQYEAALQRIGDIEQSIDNRLAESKSVQSVIDPAAVAERLSRLDEVLAGSNPPMGNIELAHHIDRIDCFSDGRVVVRTCKLGALTGAVDILKQFDDSTNGISADRKPRPNAVVPRRLSRRRVDSAEAPSDESKARAIWATDPHRFAGLDERWFEERVRHVPEPTFWAKENAAAVAESRIKLNATEAELADQFGVSTPTIHKALKVAKQTHPELLSLPRRMPRARWHEDHAREVSAKKKAENMSTQQLADYYGKSDTTIRSALNHAELLAAQSNGAAPPGDAAPGSGDEER